MKQRKNRALFTPVCLTRNNNETVAKQQ